MPPPGGERKTVTGARSLDPTAGDRQLVDACLRGSQEAWDALIAKYQRLIYSVPLKYGGTREDAADIFQAVCIELFKELPRLRNVDNLRPWLVTVAAHQSFHWKRREQRRAQREVPGPDEEEPGIAVPPGVTAELEREQLVREALARLPARCRELIDGLFYQHPALSYAEVARRLGLRPGSIGFIRGRCLKRLEQILEELGF
jgi:RNA polymerase sigma factor (sigma-70 family)